MIHHSPHILHDSEKGTRATFHTWIFAIAAILALAYGTTLALHRAWTCDDAFISFRYAENLSRGLGLVYNQGERVEGYSNFLWTMWLAAGLRVGADPEKWSIAWGAFFYGLTLSLLACNALRMRSEIPALPLILPIAALLGAAHAEWNIFGTGGLETSLYTCLAVLAYVLVVPRDVGPWRVAAAGLVLALAAMTRPDGPLLAGLVGIFVLAAGPSGLRRSAILTAAFLAIWGPFTIWRLSYYGDFFPNPYYAKSASRAWYAQGLVYAGLYFTKYWILIVGAALAVLIWGKNQLRQSQLEPTPRSAWNRRVALALLLGVGYTVYVIRVGGDFMFGRLLIPATPFFLIVLELALARLAGGRMFLQMLIAGGAAALVALMPYPFHGQGWVRGIVNEWSFYSTDRTSRTKADGMILRRYFDELPVKLVFLGSEARLVYYARPEFAIEGQTGLTDRFIAHQPIGARGRIGHEKSAPPEYILDRRAAHFAFHPKARQELHLDGQIPAWGIDFSGVRGIILTWDPALMDSLRRRGARFEDFPAHIDTLLVELPRMSEAEIEAVYPGLRRFYFEHVSDPRRERRFLERIGQEAMHWRRLPGY
jgi:hypothetical protein